MACIGSGGPDRSLICKTYFDIKDLVVFDAWYGASEKVSELVMSIALTNG